MDMRASTIYTNHPGGNLVHKQTPVYRRACEAREKNSVSPQSGCLFSASFQTFCLTARAYLNTQEYGLFCSLDVVGERPFTKYIQTSWTN